MSMAVAYNMMKRKKSPCEEHGATGCEMCSGGNMAEGGEVLDDTPQPTKAESDMAAAMRKAFHKANGGMVERVMKKHYSKGGMVANDDKILVDFEDNAFDDLANRDELEEHYTGANSGDEIGDDQEDDDRRDIISRVMRSRAKKDRMPRPA